jgi:hypothetical protein
VVCTATDSDDVAMAVVLDELSVAPENVDCELPKRLLVLVLLVITGAAANVAVEVVGGV